MRKNENELLVSILDTLASGEVVALGPLAEMHGISVRTMFGWLKDGSVMVEWQNQTMTFKKAMQAARDVMKAVVVTQSLESYVARGRVSEIYHGGQPSFLEDEELVQLGEPFWRDVLGYPDCFKRDADGNRIIRTRIEYAPAALIEKFAASAFPRVYSDKSELTLRGNVALGVSTIGVRAPLPPNVQAQLASAEPVTETRQLARPETEGPLGVTDTPERYEVEPESAASEPEQDPADDEVLPEPTPRPVGFAEVPAREPRNDLERDLFQRLEASRQRGAAT
jgi:hypothetical protein